MQLMLRTRIRHLSLYSLRGFRVSPLVLFAAIISLGAVSAVGCCTDAFGQPVACASQLSGGGGGGSGLQPCNGAAGYEGCISWAPPGGIGLPPPPPPHSLVSLPGAPGTFADWGGTPDHHDGGAGEHAVDIGAGLCTDSTCPLVYYYDTLHGVDATVYRSERAVCGYDRQFEGYVVILNLTSLDPPGVVVGRAVYLHLRSVPSSVQPVAALVTDGTLLGQVNPDIPQGTCWTGPHLHQAVRDVAPSATLTHLTGAGSNCQSVNPAPAGFDQADRYRPCYKVSW